MPESRPVGRSGDSGFAAREAALDRINDDPAWAQRVYGPAPPLGERVMRVLAELAIEVLDNERVATGVDEWDESDPRCYLYNAAYAVIEDRPEDALDYESADYPCIRCGMAKSCVGGCKTWVPQNA